MKITEEIIALKINILKDIKNNMPVRLIGVGLASTLVFGAHCYVM